MSIKIRGAVSNEAALLSDLAMRSKAHWGYSSEFIQACRAELTVLPQNIESKEFQYVVGDLDGEVVGFYALKRISPSVFELEAMFVEPKHIGHGIGRALINHAKKRAIALGGLVLTIQSDPHAEIFYRAAGGILTGTQESGSIGGRYLSTFEIPLIESSA